MRLLDTISTDLQFKYLGDWWSANLLEISGLEIDAYAQKQIRVVRLIEELGRSRVEEIFEVAQDC